MTRELASRTRPPRASFDQHNLRVASLLQQIERHLPACRWSLRWNPRVPETTIGYGHPFQKIRHDRIDELGRIGFMAQLHAETGPEKGKGAADAQACGAQATG